jgi:peptidylprolyl isomerase
LLLLSVAALAACSGGDDSSTATPAATDDAATTTAVTGPPMPRTAPDECEDAPDPADYPEGSVPQALRPCAVPTELVANPIREGTGRQAADGDTVIVDFTGVHADSGDLFDTSYLRGVPFDFVLGSGGVIPGWEQGLTGAQAGEVLKLDVPGELAYGNAPPSPDIAAGEALSFLIEVRAVIAPVTEADAPLDLVVDPSVGATTLGVVDRAVGDGAVVELGDTAIVHMLLVRGDNLVVLLNTWQRRDPLQVIMADGNTLPGIVAGLEGARVGGTRVITIPPELGFGEQGDPGLGLPAGRDLIVVAEVLGVY